MAKNGKPKRPKIDVQLYDPVEKIVLCTEPMELGAGDIPAVGDKVLVGPRVWKVKHREFGFNQEGDLLSVVITCRGGLDAPADLSTY